MNDIEVIKSKIYELRGQRVMLDFDLAVLYQVETRVLNQAVKRNRDRFPDDFMFQLTTEEWDVISSQFVMTSRMKRPKTARPLAFTEHGALMLSGVLRSEIEDILADQNDINELTSVQLDAISTALAELQADKTKLAAKPRRPIGLNV